MAPAAGADFTVVEPGSPRTAPLVASHPTEARNHPSTVRHRVGRLGSGRGVQIPSAGHLGTFGELLERDLILLLLLLWSVSHRCSDTALLTPLPTPPPLIRDAQNSLCLFQSKDSPISLFPASPGAISHPLPSHSRAISRRNTGVSLQLCLQVWIIGWLCPNYQKTTPKLPAFVSACS